MPKPKKKPVKEIRRKPRSPEKIGVNRRKNGTGMMMLTKHNVDIITGKEDLSSWSDEELLQGYSNSLKGKKGKHFRIPKVIPKEVFEELCNRILYYARHEMTAELRYAVEKHIQIIKAIDPTEPTGPQIKAIEMLYDRVLGKPKERVEVMGRLELAPWQKAVAQGIVGSEEELKAIEEGEIVEDEESDALTSD